MNKYTFKITNSDNQQMTITVYAHDSRAAFDQVDRIISDIKAFEIIEIDTE